MHEDLEYDRDNVLRNASDEQGALTAEIAELLKNDGYIKSNAADIVGDVDAVIFTGGEDISSQLYAIPEPWHGIEEEIDYNATRDSNDFMLMDYCLDNNIPVLGICRGVQMLAIVSGAKMIQDIPTFMSELGVVYSYEHRNVKGTPDSYRDYAPHDVNIKEGSLAHKFSGETLIQGVPSWHHQAIVSTEGTNLEVTGTLNVNGVEMIEIVERTDKDFAVGIQYHPEAVIDKSMDCQTNASDYMSYEDALEVFTYLIELVR
jgi:putative glutamine amidotransferase